MKVEYLDTWAQKAAEILQEASGSGKVVDFVQLDITEARSLLLEMMPDIEAGDPELDAAYRLGEVLYASVRWVWPVPSRDEEPSRVTERAEPKTSTGSAGGSGQWPEDAQPKVTVKGF